MPTENKPSPVVSLEDKIFWEYAREHQLRMQKCLDCGFVRYPSGIICPNCHSMREPDWEQLSGRGEIYSFVIFYHIYHKGFSDEVPYAVASIKLDEGPRLIGRILGCDMEDIRVGMAVEVCFNDISEKFTLPQFQPAS